MTDTVDAVRVLTKEIAGEVLVFASSIVEAFAREVVSTEEKSFYGGALAVLSMREDGFQIGSVVGKLTDAAGVEFMTYAITKNNAMHEFGVILSEKVSDFSVEPPIYGGGIKPGDASCLSFSGFPPEWDQAFCLMVSEYFEIIEPQRVNSIIEQSEDPLKARVYLQEARMFLMSHILKTGLHR